MHCVLAVEDGENVTQSVSSFALASGLVGGFNVLGKVTVWQKV